VYNLSMTVGVFSDDFHKRKVDGGEA